MFTGIVQAVGTLRRTGVDGVEIVVDPSIRGQLTGGASVSVNGVCLTVRALSDDGFFANLSPETRARTTFCFLRPGARVNLEPALPAGGRLDGHLVLGHVDAVGRIAAFHSEGRGWTLVVAFSGAFAHLVAEKGSVAVDGISLTPYAVESGSFRCAIVPETYERTALAARRSGDPVNLEFDVLAKYVERMMRRVHAD